MNFELILQDLSMINQVKWNFSHVFRVEKTDLPSVSFDEKPVINNIILLLRFKEPLSAKIFSQMPWNMIVNRISLYGGKMSSLIDTLIGGPLSHLHDLTMRYVAYRENFLIGNNCVAVPLPFELDGNQTLDLNNSKTLFSNFLNSLRIDLNRTVENEQHMLTNVAIVLKGSVVKLPARRHIWQSGETNYHPMHSLKKGTKDTYRICIDHDIPQNAALRFIFFSMLEEVSDKNESGFYKYVGPINVTLTAPLLLGKDRVVQMESTRDAWMSALNEQENAQISAEKLCDLSAYVYTFTKNEAQLHANGVIDDAVFIDIQFQSEIIPTIIVEAKIAYDLLETDPATK